MSISQPSTFLLIGNVDNLPEFAYYEAIMPSDAATSIRLPSTCETALLERFLKAEAMALWTVRSARLQDVPPNVYAFLRKHEEDEEQHLAQFETMIGRQPRERERLPSVPRQWPALAVQLYGYESLGLEFATLLVTLRPDLVSIRKDELVHVEFFERRFAACSEDGTGPLPSKPGSPRLHGGGNCRERSIAISTRRRSIRSACAGRRILSAIERRFPKQDCYRNR